MSRTPFLWLGLVSALIFAMSLQAETISLGVVSFNSLIPGAPGTPGVNDFAIDNLTGDPGSGGFALPPDFPSLTTLTFQDAQITLWSGLLSQNYLLGDILPGSLISASLEFPDTVGFTSAVFTAGFSTTGLALPGGSTFFPATSVISAVIVPSSGPTLTPGVDFALLQVSDAAIPEPANAILCACALALCVAFRRRRP